MSDQHPTVIPDGGDEVETEGSTESRSTRYWLTNDVGFFLILGSYQLVWAAARLSPLVGEAPLEMPWGGDLGAFLALLAALTWGFGTDFIRAYQEVNGGSSP